jgi:predicted nucleic acid-binding protein
LTGIVIDASVVAAWLMPDEQSAFAQETSAKVVADGAMAPALFWYELRNMLLSNERRQRLSGEEFVQALRALRMLPIALHQIGDDYLCFALARRHRLSFYDAAYLALALTESAPLATLDTSLAAAAKSERVSLIA